MNFLRNLWAHEPVLVGTLVPLLVTAGVITADQATAITNAVAGVVAVAVILLGAFGVRATVTSPATLAKQGHPQPGAPFSGGHIVSPGIAVSADMGMPVIQGNVLRDNTIVQPEAAPPTA